MNLNYLLKHTPLALSLPIPLNISAKKKDGAHLDSLLWQVATAEEDPNKLNLSLQSGYFWVTPGFAYHGLREKDKSFDTEFVTHFDAGLPLVSVAPQDIDRVLLNLFNNAFYAVQRERLTDEPDYKVMIGLPSLAKDTHMELTVNDNGGGVPDAIKDKIMQPFFTTKPTGEGTGLGLSLSYDIVVKGHGGSVTVNSTVGERPEFICR